MIRPPRSEEGSALVLALVFLSLFGLAIAAILSFADTSIRTTFAVRAQGKALYAADGAVEGAINAIRYNGQGGYGDPCESVMVPVNGEVVTVTCEPQAGSGAPTGANNSDNTPSNAILTLGTDGAEGIDQVSNSPLRVDGDIFSHSTVRNRAAKAAMSVDGVVSAYGDCIGTIASTQPPLHCSNTGGGQSAAGSIDPGYAHDGGFLGTAALPSCPSGSTWLVEFQPGRYTDASALNALTAGSCVGRVFWFQPGNYYFDFEDASAPHEWLIQDAGANVVGGTPKGWNPAAASRPSLPHPGACTTAADPAPNDGVKFIFGNDSRVRILAGTTELCAQPSATSQQIAVYGVTATTGTPASPTVSPAPSASPTPSCPSAGQIITLLPTGITATQGTWSSLAEGRIIDGATADSTLPAQSGGGSRSKVTLTGFDQAPVPNGCDVAAKIVVTHREGSTNMHSITAVVTGAGATSTKTDSSWTQCINAATELCLQSTLTQNSVALPEFNSPSHFANLSMTWEARASNNKSSQEYLDGVRLEVTLSEPVAPSPSASPTPTTPPGFSDYYRAQAGCISVAPYGSAGSCALLHAEGIQTKLIVNGTMYAPLAALDIQMTNVLASVFGRGVIARHLTTSMSPSPSYTGSLIAVPDSGGGASANRTVTLKAFISGVVRLRAVVEFEDGGGSSPGLAVRIESWSVLR